jgi:signal transduction histidine kinase
MVWTGIQKSNQMTDENITLRDELQRLQNDCLVRDRQFNALRRTSLAAMQSSNMDELTERVLDIAVRVVHADAGSMFLHHPRSRKLVFAAVVGDASGPLTGTGIPEDRGIAGHVFQTGLPILDDNMRMRSDFDPDTDNRTGFQTRSTITIPLCAPGGRPVGVLQVLNGQDPFTQRDLSVLEVLCTHAALGIERIRLAAQSRDAQIGHRVGEIAHDIKNLMTPIESGALTAQSLVLGLMHDLNALIESDDTPCRQQLNAAVRNAKDAAGWILEDVVTSAERVRRRTEYIAGMVKGRLPEPNLEADSILGIIQQVQKTLGRYAKSRGIDLYCHVDPSTNPVLHDKDQMYDALYNLVNNALQATPDGGTVSITASNSVHITSLVEISVTDTGHGMTEETRSKLFTDEVVSTKHGGTGLGTSIVGRVVIEHHGNVSVKSRLGRGSVFTIQLPAYNVAHGKTIAA